MKIVVLGSGTSYGIPEIGCNCPVCTSEDPRDKRMRTAVYIEGSGGERALIDAGPEFRLQAVRAGINRLDGIFLTHAHADHIHGLDDVRSLSRNNPLPVYGNERTIAEMEERFSYIWVETQPGGGKPRLTPLVVSPTEPVKIGGLTFTPVPVKHGILDILGWEVRENTQEGTGNFLYLTDTSAILPAVQAQLRGRDPQNRVIVIGGLRVRPHETHFNFEQALNTALDLGARAIYLTHICHEHFHTEIEEFCLEFKKNQRLSDPSIEKMEIHPACDGLEFTL